MRQVFTEIATLDNGVELCLNTIPDAEVVRIDMEFAQAGSYHAPSDKLETAHLMEHMIFQGSERFPTPRYFRDALESNGSYTNAFTHRDRMQYHLASPIIGYRNAFNTFLDAIQHPLFSEEALESEQDVVRSEFTGYLNEPNQILWPAMYRALGRSKHGTLEEHLGTLGEINSDDLRAHHQRTHTLGSMQVIITGGLAKKDTKNIISTLESLELPTGQGPEPETFPDYQPDIPVLIERPSQSDLYYVLGRFAMETITYEDMTLAATMLTRLFSHPDSTITREARNQGLVYGIWGDTAEDNGEQSFYILGDVNHDKAAPLWELVIDRLPEATSNITAAELKKLRTYILGSLSLSAENNSAIHERARHQFLQYGQVYPIETIADSFNKMTIKEYRTCLPKIFQGGVALAGAIGAPEAVNDPEVQEALLQAQETLRGM